MTVKFLYNPPRVSLFKDINAQSVANDAALAFGTTIGWDGEEYDDFGMHAAGTSANIVIPVTGLYYVSAKVWFTGNATGVRYIQCFNSTTSTILGYTRLLATGGTANIDLSWSRDVQLAEGDVIQVKATQNSGVSLPLIIGDPSLCNFQARWVGQS